MNEQAPQPEESLVERLARLEQDMTANASELYMLYENVLDLISMQSEGEQDRQHLIRLADSYVEFAYKRRIASMYLDPDDDRYYHNQRESLQKRIEGLDLEYFEL